MATKKISISALSLKAQKALRQAVRRLVQEHRRLGQPVVVWREGKVVRIPANRLV